MASAGEIRAGAAYYELSARDGVTPVLARAKASAATFGTFMQSFGGRLARVFAGGAAAATDLARGLAKVGAALGAAGAAGVAGFKPALDAVGELSELGAAGQVLGLRAEQASRLFGVMKAGGSDLRDAVEGLATFNQRVDDALAGKSDEAVDLFTKLGVSADKFARLRTDERFYALLAAVKANVPEMSQLLVLMKAVGEDTGKNLKGTLALTADQVRELGDAFQASAADVEAASRASRAYALVVAGVGRVWREVAAAIAPALTTVADLVAGAIKPVVEWVRENKALVAVTLVAAGGLVILGAAAVGASLAITGLATAFGVLKSIAVGAVAVITSPYTLAIAAIGGTIYALAKYTEAGRQATAMLREKLAPALDQTRTVFGAIGTAIERGDLAGALDVAGAALEAVWAGALNKITQLWVDFKSTIGEQFYDVFGGLGPAVEGGLKLAGDAFRWLKKEFLATLDDVAQFWERLKRGAAQAVAYVEELWERFGPAVVNAIKPIVPVLAAIAAPVVAAVRLVEEAWDGLDKSILITMTRLAKNVEEAWARVTGGIGNAFRALSVQILQGVIEAAAALNAVKPDDNLKKLIETAQAAQGVLAKGKVNVDGEVERIRKLYDDVEIKISNDAKAARAEREKASADQLAAAAEQLAGAQGKLGAAVDRATRFDFGGAGAAAALGVVGPGGAPNPGFVPSSSVRGAFASDTLGQQLGAGRQSETKQIVDAIKANSAEAIGRSVADRLMEFWRVGN